MENINNITVLFGTLIALLLSVVAYFIKQLHTDFKSMEKDLVEVKTMALIIKTEFKSGNDLLNQKVEYLENRVNIIELSILKKLIMKNSNMNLVERVKAPTPKWFKIIRNIGIALATVGGVILASPVILPVGLVSAAGYLILGGSIISTVSQTGVKTEEEPEPIK